MKTTNETNEKQNLMMKVKMMIHKLRDLGVSEKELVSLMHIEQPLLKLTISRDYRLYLGEQRTEIRMEPLVKAVYLLFLRHPEGIIFKNLPDYRQELTRIYSDVRPWGLTDRALQSIEDVTNPMLNSINEKCARIRKAFSEQLPKSVARYYSISGKRGEVKKIDLVRANVVWKCKMPTLVKQNSLVAKIKVSIFANTIYF